MNQGMYRAGPGSAGLPLPRAHLGVFTAAIAAASALVVLVPLVVFAVAGRGAGGGWAMFRNGGAAMWLLVLLDLALPVAIGVAGAFAVRGKRVPAGLFFGIATVPFVTASFFAFIANRLLEGIFAGESIDPLAAMRIRLAAMSETLSLDVLGGAVACACAIAGAIAAASVVASIDVATATRTEPSRPPAVFGAAALVSGVAWFVATLIVTAFRVETIGVLAVFVLLAVGVLVPVAVLAARAAPVLRTWHDPIEARRAASALLVAALSAIFAVVVLERVLVASVGSAVFGAVSGEGVDPSQRARILMELVDTRRWSAIATAIHGVLGTATFGLALAGSLGPSRTGFRHPISPSALVALAVGVFVIGATFALSAARASTTERIAARANRASNADAVTLPVMPPELGATKSPRGRPIVVRADDEAEPSPADAFACPRGGGVVVEADRAVTVATLGRRLPPACRSLFYLAASPKKEPAREARLGDLAVFVSLDRVMLGVTFDPDGIESRRRTGVLVVRSLSAARIAYEDHEVSLPIDADAPDLRAPAYSAVRLVLRPQDSVDHLVATIAGLRQRFPGRIPPGPAYVDSERPNAAVP